MSENKSCLEYKQDVRKRLNKIEGQVKGIQRMIDEEKNCVDILTQIAAVRSAINKVGGMVLEVYSNECMKDAIDSDDKEKVMGELMNAVQKFLKFVD
ncbi:metal-sensitive transcriptional regulator [Pseudobacteroides cellulosolvens]|uniref:Metal sensitive transcriptional repressor n=1 Tax=Pseudobacteroides cellulosolvens ATCC 35603 = DSM 2933 TaxID=398512 RepID=A0A0L6JP27_9FIRM|nr:metal-sensitive transcriptional regulator [Pseudobacteroides cellulosolvens]KNY27533.1 metal sensitive transcriptional repressor [Pseudobacteroides cellulosolvens ATCC 35603 = DSM 2933]